MTVKPSYFDVGISRLNDKIVGDVKFDQEDKVKAITPVPGYSPMTILSLANNLVKVGYQQSMKEGN